MITGPVSAFIRSRAKISLALNAICVIAILYLAVGHSTFVLTTFRGRIRSNEPGSAPAQDQDIPRKIWQTWHTPAPLLADEDKARVRTWLEKNPDYQYELITDNGAEGYVRHGFAENPLIRDVFLNLTDPILRADFLRYLLLLADGGVYADLDVECREPIDTWIPQLYRGEVSVVLGIEADRKPVENDVKLYYDHREHVWGITNWTLMSKRGHPFLRYVAEAVANNLLEVAREQERTLSTMELSYKEVIDATGPRAFTDAFLTYVSKVTGRTITYADATKLEEPKLIDDILLLPIRAFSSSEADRADVEGAHSYGWPSFVYHWSVGTWKKTHFQKPESETRG